MKVIEIGLLMLFGGLAFTAISIALALSLDERSAILPMAFDMGTHAVACAMMGAVIVGCSLVRRGGKVLLKRISM